MIAWRTSYATARPAWSVRCPGSTRPGYMVGRVETRLTMSTRRALPTSWCSTGRRGLDQRHGRRRRRADRRTWGWVIFTLVGASIGGFIAQAVALEHAERFSTLSLIIDLRRISPRRASETASLRPAAAATGGRRPGGHLPVVESWLIGSPGFAFDEQYLRDLAGRSWDRGHYGAGSRRQLAAVVNQPNRTAALAVSPSRRCSSTDSTTAGRAQGASRSPRPSRTPASSGSPAWVTTCPGHCGPNSSGRSRRSPHGRTAPPPQPPIG